MVSKKPPKLIRTDLESKLQAEICKWLRSKGCFVWKCAENATTKRGVSDIFWAYKSTHGFLEVKAHEWSPYRAGQDTFLATHAPYCLATAVYKENLAEVFSKIEEKLSKEDEKYAG